jgi:hypothetical protein
MKIKSSIALHLIAIVALSLLNLSFAYAQQRRKIFIEHADLMRNLKKDGVEIRRLIGNVVIRHDDITMKCDSAYEFVGSNRFDAFGKVIVIQEDTRLYGDTLHYDGNSKTGRVRGKIVRLVEKDAELVTKFLDFNTQENTAYFYGGGIITSEDSKFSCERGVYYSRRKQFAFSGDVAYLNPDLLLNTDSLTYITDLELIFFFGPTRIYSKDNFIFCENGWHNRNEQESEFQINAYIDNGKQQIFGERIFSSNKTGYSQVTGRGCLVDSTRNLRIFGDTINYFDNENYSEVKNNPLAFSISDEGDSLYLRADLFLAISVEDTLNIDNSYDLLQGIGNVKFHRKDFQGICDSMVYHSTDSILHMYYNPVIWNEDNQLSANYINFKFKDEMIYRMNFIGSSFICSQEDSTRFNQIKGRDMIGFFAGGRLYKLDVEGNAETVYFARDKGILTAVNRAEGSRLSINLKDNKVRSIMFKEKPVATLFPLDKAEPEDVFIRGFTWHIDKRPAISVIIPKGLNIDFYFPIQEKAKLYRDKRKNPDDSL